MKEGDLYKIRKEDVELTLVEIIKIRSSESVGGPEYWKTIEVIFLSGIFAGKKRIFGYELFNKRFEKISP